MKTLDEILKNLTDSEGRDAEGDRSFRVHINTAKALIKEAYSAGMSSVQAERNLKGEDK